MQKSAMLACINALKNLHTLLPAIERMQETHASDHVTPTHTVRGGADLGAVKSFFMKSAMVQEQQGYSGTGWAGPKKNFVTVPGYASIDAAGEKAIIRAAIKQEEFMVVSADDHVGAKFLFATGTPSPYAGFDYLDGAALPIKVPLTVLVIRAGLNTKLLSVYPSAMSYLERQGTIHTIA